MLCPEFSAALRFRLAAFRRLVAAAISVILVVAVAVTLRSSSASGWRSVDADELLAAPAKQLKAQHTRGVEPVRPHVFDR